MSPYIISIPNIHDLYVKESSYLPLSLLENYVSGNILIIASTHYPQKVDPAPRTNIMRINMYWVFQNLIGYLQYLYQYRLIFDI